MRLRVAAFGALVALAVWPQPALSQGNLCSTTRPADVLRLTNARGELIVYFRDPLYLACPDGTTVRADSAVINQTTNAFELLGNVVYQDTTRELRSEWANYMSRTGILHARGDVRLVELRDGSTVTGDQLEYMREMPTRPVAHTVITGTRPHATLRARQRREPRRPDPESPGTPDRRPPVMRPDAPADTSQPTEIWATRMEFVGETLFLADGDVEIQRGGMTGRSDSARYDQFQERITLTGSASVEDDRYRLDGRLIDALVSGNELQTVVADEDARLESEELVVESDRIRIGFLDGRIDRMQAWMETAPPGDAELADPEEPAVSGVPATPVEPVAPGAAIANPARSRDSAGSRGRALAVARDFLLRADSIDARANLGQLREVRAVGRGYGERIATAPGRTDLPPTLARDWIRGDTIIGYFAVPDTAETGPEAAERDADSAGVALERIVVIGGQGRALSLYRMEPEDGSRGAINFMQASRIVLFMAVGEVSRVEAEGPIQGYYLDPRTGRPSGTPPPEGSVRGAETTSGAR